MVPAGGAATVVVAVPESCVGSAIVKPEPEGVPAEQEYESESGDKNTLSPLFGAPAKTTKDDTSNRYASESVIDNGNSSIKKFGIG